MVRPSHAHAIQGAAVVQVSCCIRFLLNDLAVLEKGVEGLDLIEEQTIGDHVLVVGSQFDQGLP